jgi:MerR family transcriptional regulator, light-induced transcriptional regulator
MHPRGTRVARSGGTVKRAGPAAEDVFADYLAAVRAGDRRAAFHVIDEARDAGVELHVLHLEVFQPTLREVGRLWQENVLTVADEHLATAITQAAMARAFEQRFTWSDAGQHTLIAACADTERHEVGLRMICDLLELQGWETTFLGATVPIDSLVTMIERKRPDAVALSVALAPHIPRLRAVVDQIRALIDEPPLILVGGRPFLDDPSLATRIGADLTAADAVEAVTLLREHVGAS